MSRLQQSARRVAPLAGRPLTEKGQHMDWIKSSGGPLVCMERDLAPLWNGVQGSKSALNSTGISDYDRACQVRDYLGKIEMGRRSALILGEMPLQTMIGRPSDEPPLIVRVFYADPDADVLKIL